MSRQIKYAYDLPAFIHLQLPLSLRFINKLLHDNSGYYRNCLSHPLASLSFTKLFIGIGGGLKRNKRFIINLARPGFETMAIAE